ncbi:MAG: peptidase C11 [Deltaproteobacteria bacterium]|nr:peptidase C11 [Deltaproteobacteria bacterium]
MHMSRVIKKQWTVMVYMAGDNNLDGAGVIDLMEMKKIGSTSGLNIIVQFDLQGKNKSTNRYYIQKRGSLAGDIVARLGETNMGDPKVLENFVAWGAKNYPSMHYLLVLWNHGAGWDDANLYEGDVFGGALPPVSRKRQPMPARKTTRRGAKALPFTIARAALSRTRRALFSTSVATAMSARAIAFDDQAQDFLDNLELKKVMRRVRKILKKPVDILGMDACLMSMIEVAYQMRDLAAFTVGSEETEPGDGWPYDRILKTLASRPYMTPDGLSKEIVKQYLASYSASDNVTQSALRLADLKNMIRDIDALGGALKAALSDEAKKAAIMTVRAGAQEYSRPYDDYCDLLDLCGRLEKVVKDSAVRDACSHVAKAAGAAIIASGYKGTAVDGSRGISIYFPKRRISPLYNRLDFTRASSWDEFLKSYIISIGR